MSGQEHEAFAMTRYGWVCDTCGAELWAYDDLDHATRGAALHMLQHASKERAS